VKITDSRVSPGIGDCAGDLHRYSSPAPRLSHPKGTRGEPGSPSDVLPWAQRCTPRGFRRAKDLRGRATSLARTAFRWRGPWCPRLDRPERSVRSSWTYWTPPRDRPIWTRPPKTTASRGRRARTAPHQATRLLPGESHCGGVAGFGFGRHNGAGDLRTDLPANANDKRPWPASIERRQVRRRGAHQTRRNAAGAPDVPFLGERPWARMQPALARMAHSGVVGAL